MAIGKKSFPRVAYVQRGVDTDGSLYFDISESTAEAVDADLGTETPGRLVAIYRPDRFVRLSHGPLVEKRL